MSWVDNDFDKFLLQIQILETKKLLPSSPNWPRLMKFFGKEFNFDAAHISWEGLYGSFS